MISKIVQKLRGEDVQIGEFSRYELFIIVMAKIKSLVYGNFRYGLLKSKLGFYFIHPSSNLINTRRIKFFPSVTIGRKVKINALGAKSMTFGKNFSIRDYSIIESFGSIKKESGKLQVGNNVGISELCHFAIRGDVSIGNDVIFGPKCMIFSENHGMRLNETPFRLQDEIRQNVQIGNNVWLGANVIILPGTIIEDNCIIAAGSVVNKLIESNSVYAGVPAKKIKNLK